MSNYYRGGPYVPTTRTVVNSEGPYYVGGEYLWRVSGSNVTIFWAAALITEGGYGAATTSISYGGYLYVRGAYVSGSGTFFNPLNYYVSRQTSSTVTINTGVPSSGTLYISQLYGAANP
jgi:hypothetical protein